LAMMPSGTPITLASSLTSVLYRSPMGMRSAPPSPYLVKYPMSSSDLLPVPMTNRPSMLAWAYRMVIRMRAMRFPDTSLLCEPGMILWYVLSSCSMSYTKRVVPQARLIPCTSRRSCVGVLGEGMNTFSTLSPPRASTHSLVTTAESMPPDRPITTPEAPASLTCVWMKSVIVSTVSSFSCGIGYGNALQFNNSLSGDVLKELEKRAFVFPYQ